MEFKIKSQIRRVFSDRALKVAKSSHTKALIQQENQHQLDTSLTLAPTPKLAAKFSSQVNNSPKVVLQPFKTYEIKDKDALIAHVKQVYEETANSDGGSLVFATQSIGNSILHFMKCAHNSGQITNVYEFIKENLYQTNYQLSCKYKDNKTCDNLRIEAQLQILLDIEGLVLANDTAKLADDDYVWEMANSIRWLNQTFKEKFKIEKFLFGEIYSNYYQSAPEFILNLMEELGYDKDENSSWEANSTQNEASNSTFTSASQKTTTGKMSTSASLNSFSGITAVANSSKVGGKSISKSVVDLNSSNLGSEDDDVFERSVSNQTHEDDDDILNDFKKKKTFMRFPSASLDTSKSIVVQQKKRMKLKMRSPYKSPSKRDIKWLQNSDNLRRSPRIKESEKQKNKRVRDPIEDTPVQKQNATRMATRQQKIIKRISFHNIKTPSVVLDTPVKNNPNTVVRGTPSPKK